MTSFSILYKKGNAGIAPLYDLLSTAVYPNLSPRMAMSIGGVWEFADVSVRSFDAFAVKCDVNPKFVRGRIDHLLSNLSSAMNEVTEELSDTGHYSPVFRAIMDQSQQRAGQLRE